MFSTDEGWAIGRIFAWSLVVIGVIGLFTIVGLAFFPAQLWFEHEANTHSHQYSEARATEILNTVAECERLNIEIEYARSQENYDLVNALENHKAALYNSARAAVNKLHDTRTFNLAACH